MEKRLKKYLENGEFKNVPIARSKTMAAVRGKNNKTTELKLRMGLIRNRISGWTLHPSEILGKPDFYFPKKKVAIFIDGCFWHGCPYCGHIPKTRSAFWRAKIKRNKTHDKRINFQLNASGTIVLRFWEHQLKTVQGLKDMIFTIRQVNCYQK